MAEEEDGGIPSGRRREVEEEEVVESLVEKLRFLREAEKMLLNSYSVFENHLELYTLGN